MWLWFKCSLKNWSIFTWSDPRICKREKLHLHVWTETQMMQSTFIIHISTPISTHTTRWLSTLFRNPLNTKIGWNSFSFYYKLLLGDSGNTWSHLALLSYAALTQPGQRVKENTETGLGQLACRDRQANSKQKATNHLLTPKIILSGMKNTCSKNLLNTLLLQSLKHYQSQ